MSGLEEIREKPVDIDVDYCRGCEHDMTEECWDCIRGVFNTVLEDNNYRDNHLYYIGDDDE